MKTILSRIPKDNIPFLLDYIDTALMENEELHGIFESSIFAYANGLGDWTTFREKVIDSLISDDRFISEYKKLIVNTLVRVIISSIYTKLMDCRYADTGGRPHRLYVIDDVLEGSLITDRDIRGINMMGKVSEITALAIDTIYDYHREEYGVPVTMVIELEAVYQDLFFAEDIILKYTNIIYNCILRNTNEYHSLVPYIVSSVDDLARCMDITPMTRCDDIIHHKNDYYLVGSVL